SRCRRRTSVGSSMCCPPFMIGRCSMMSRAVRLTCLLVGVGELELASQDLDGTEEPLAETTDLAHSDIDRQFSCWIETWRKWSLRELLDVKSERSWWLARGRRR